MIPSQIKKHSFMVRGKKTSVSLEPEFRAVLDRLAADLAISTNALVCRIDAGRSHANLSSAIRLFALRNAAAVMARENPGSADVHA